jgi:hypothetical protein
MSSLTLLLLFLCGFLNYFISGFQASCKDDAEGSLVIIYIFTLTQGSLLFTGQSLTSYTYIYTPATT